MTADPEYAAQARALDDAILGAIARWRERSIALDDAAFDDLAGRVFAHQLRYNQPYARYCASLGVRASAPFPGWREIPPVPAAAFKESTLATFDPARAELAFSTSGTTAGRSGRHYLERAELYDATSLAAFDAFVLPDRARLRYCNLVPDPARQPTSSLGRMMRVVTDACGTGRTGWYLDNGELRFDSLMADLHEASVAGQAVCIASTAFALVHALDAMDAAGTRLQLAPGSRLMETGGFKGRSRVVDRDDLYARTAEAFGLSQRAIVAEYGMTELSSQYYDDVLVRPQPDLGTRMKVAPPWLRTRVVGPNGSDLPDGTVGALVHVDLANRSSCIAVATEDLGARFDGKLVLIGRERGAELRGCSLDAETLLPR